MNNGPIAQLGARLNGIEKVASSNLAGSTDIRDQVTDRECAIMAQIRKKGKVTTGVVGHPVSEKGERGGSPSKCPTERVQDRTRLPLGREIALVKPVVSAGDARYS